ncbi:Amuc_1102 family pilus-like protein [Haloferula chungangensis]|uniref:Amuc_1102 family pilus-like protein n=1 Tax=Haloferula chungangensis TaxID=1048331 RepID=A0ABW2L2F6_9BACT
MKNSLSLLRKGAAVAAAATMVLSGSAFGQGKAEVGKIAFDGIQSPQVDTGRNKNWKPKEWLEFETGIKLPAYNQEQKDSGFVDQITVKWSVALKNPDGRGFILLTKDINHINVPIDEEVFTCVYLSPNTLKRVTGSDTAGKSSVDRVAVEVLVNGRAVAAESSKGNPDWVTSGSLSNQSNRFPLLNKMETPFAMLWWDRYAEIEEQR